MSKEDARERTRSESDGGSSDRTFDRSSGRDRVSVSSRTSWSGLAKRALNVSNRRSGGTDTVGVAKLVGAMLAGAFVTWLLPVPLVWLAGLALGAAVGGRLGDGSTTAATVTGGVLGLVGGFALVGIPLFGPLLPVVTAVAGGAAGAVGYLAGVVTGR